MGVDNLLHDHVELPHILDIAVHLELFYQSTISWLKVISGGVVAHVILLVSAQVLCVLILDFGLRTDKKNV